MQGVIPRTSTWCWPIVFDTGPPSRRRSVFSGPPRDHIVIPRTSIVFDAGPTFRWTSRVFMPCRVSFPERLRDVGPLSSTLGHHHVDVPCFQGLHGITLSFPEHPAFSFRWTSGVFMPYRVSFPEPPSDGGPSSSTLGQHQVEVPCFQGIHAITLLFLSPPLIDNCKQHARRRIHDRFL